jgi:hypothetical protein
MQRRRRRGYRAQSWRSGWRGGSKNSCLMTFSLEPQQMGAAQRQIA